MDFQTLARRDLQALCKLNKIPANMTNVAMADALRSLEIVEGIEEFLIPSQSETAQSSIDSPEKDVVTSPVAPRTGCRTSTRRLATKEEAKNDAPKTPALRSSRKRAPAASSVKKTVTQSKEAEETPAVVPKSRRQAARGTQLKEVQSVYSTRRSVRLLGKSNVMEKGRSDAVKMDSYMEEVIEIVKEKSDLGEVLDTARVVHEIDLEVSMERTNDSEDVSVTKSEEESGDLTAEDSKAIDDSDTVFVTDKHSKSLVTEEDGDVEGGVSVNEGDDESESKSEVGYESSDASELQSSECLVKALGENELLGSKGSEKENLEVDKGICAEVTAAVEFTSSGCSGLHANFILKGEDSATNLVKDAIQDPEIGSAAGESNGNAADNAESDSDHLEHLAYLKQLDDNTEESNVGTFLNCKESNEHAAEPLADSFHACDAYAAEEIAAETSADSENTLKESGIQIEVDISKFILQSSDNNDPGLGGAVNVIPEIVSNNELLPSSDKTNISVKQTSYSGPPSSACLQFLNAKVTGSDSAASESVDITRLTPVKKPASKTPTSVRRMTYVSDDKENIDNRESNLELTKQKSMKSLKERAEDEKLKPTKDMSLRLLSKMLKEQLEEKNTSKAAKTRPALHILSENRLVEGETERE